MPCRMDRTYPHGVTIGSFSDRLGMGGDIGVSDEVLLCTAARDTIFERPTLVIGTLGRYRRNFVSDGNKARQWSLIIVELDVLLGHDSDFYLYKDDTIKMLPKPAIKQPVY